MALANPTTSQNITFFQWIQSGYLGIWVFAGSVTISIALVFGLMYLILSHGLSYFWPSHLYSFEYAQGDQTVTIIGEKANYKSLPAYEYGPDTYQLLIKTGNKHSLPSDFMWIDSFNIQSERRPPLLVSIERREWGNAYGYIDQAKIGDRTYPANTPSKVIKRALTQRLDYIREARQQIETIELTDINLLNAQLNTNRLSLKALEYDENKTPSEKEASRQHLLQEEQSLSLQYQQIEIKLNNLYQSISGDSLKLRLQTGETTEISLQHIIRFWYPNSMSLSEKLSHYFVGLYHFLTEYPREANTEGGVFPAIFGTVLMVILMTIIVTPIGVLAAIYLQEYAKPTFTRRIILIAVNNLAGVPSVVYGVFGLGFFVYFTGGFIDETFFPLNLPSPTFGTPGLLWASLTLALMTLPVVIVSTQEGLYRIPTAIKEGSMALGATKAETIFRVILPMATPAMMTGVILAISRAAGEVAPLMLVGAVKLAPQLPVDQSFPFLHLDRKFMHLGFHIYDLGFQSPNIDASRPLVYMTALLLVSIVFFLNLSAILLRNRLNKRFKHVE